MVTLFDEADIYSDPPPDFSLLRFQLQSLINAVEYRERRAGPAAVARSIEEPRFDEMTELRRIRELEVKMAESLEFLRAQRVAVERALTARIRGLEDENDQPPRGFDRSEDAEKAD